jgi:hypothetical protein
VALQEPEALSQARIVLLYTYPLERGEQVGAGDKSLTTQVERNEQIALPLVHVAKCRDGLMGTVAMVTGPCMRWVRAEKRKLRINVDVGHGLRWVLQMRRACSCYLLPLPETGTGSRVSR